MMKLNMMPGPEFSMATFPVSTKIPVPMMQPIPMAMSDQTFKVRLSLCSPPSDSARICSTVFFAKMLLIVGLLETRKRKNKQRAQ